MRMYELWKVTTRDFDASRLEDEGGPVLFPRVCDAEECSRDDADYRDAEFQIVPVRVGLA